MAKNHRRLVVQLVLPLTLFVSACQSVHTTQGGTVGVNRSQYMMVSAQELDQQAAKQYLQVTTQAQKEHELNRDPVQVARVRNIANRLIAQTPVFRPDAQKWQWEINVLTSDEVNAWCMPGGKIAVYTGLINKLKPTDDELAAVMGHEISHALREHARERISEQTFASGAISLGSAIFGLGSLGQQSANYLYKGLVNLPNSRGQETEADRMGVELAARAGYDPRAAITLWQKMAKIGGSDTLAILSTHPSREDRVADLGDYSQRVMPLYQQAKNTR